MISIEHIKSEYNKSIFLLYFKTSDLRRRIVTYHIKLSIVLRKMTSVYVDYTLYIHLCGNVAKLKLGPKNWQDLMILIEVSWSLLFEWPWLTQGFIRTTIFCRPCMALMHILNLVCLLCFLCYMRTYRCASAPRSAHTLHYGCDLGTYIWELSLIGQIISSI
jgi:hypothetical protein